MNDKGVCRGATATPGLLKNMHFLCQFKENSEKTLKLLNLMQHNQFHVWLCYFSPLGLGDIMKAREE